MNVSSTTEESGRKARQVCVPSHDRPLSASGCRCGRNWRATSNRKNACGGCTKADASSVSGCDPQTGSKGCERVRTQLCAPLAQQSQRRERRNRVTSESSTTSRPARSAGHRQRNPTRPIKTAEREERTHLVGTHPIQHSLPRIGHDAPHHLRQVPLDHLPIAPQPR